KELNEYWQKAKILQKEYNEKVSPIKTLIQDQIVLELKNNFPLMAEYDGEITKCRYFSENIAKTLYSSSFYDHKKNKIPDFELNLIEIETDFHRIMNYNGTLIQCPNQKDLDVGKLRQILSDVYSQLQLNDKIEELNQKYAETSSKLQAFGELLENKIVNNVDAKGGYLVKGKCDS